MKIITTALEGKGGVGASATAVNLYVEISKRHTVLMIDIDENKHTTKFFEARRDENYSLEENVDSIEKMEEVMGYATSEELYDFIIIDSGKYISDLNTYTLNISDLIIVPTSDSGSDFIQAQQFVQKLQDIVISENDYTQVKLLVNRVHVNATKFHREMKDFYKNKNRVGVFKTIMAENKAYKDMSLSGKSAGELTNNKRVCSDIENLALEVEEV